MTVRHRLSCFLPFGEKFLRTDSNRKGGITINTHKTAKYEPKQSYPRLHMMVCGYDRAAQRSTDCVKCQSAAAAVEPRCNNRLGGLAPAARVLSERARPSAAGASPPTCYRFPYPSQPKSGSYIISFICGLFLYFAERSPLDFKCLSKKSAAA